MIEQYKGSESPEHQKLPEVPKRPGGPLKEKPIEINGEFYDPLNPPRAFETPEGKKEYRGGKRLERDEAYSMMFWAGNKPEGLRRAMEENLRIAAESGIFSQFVTVHKIEDGKIELDEESKEKLSAYRILAKEMGYAVEGYQFHENAGTVEAEIKRVL